MHYITHTQLFNGPLSGTTRVNRYWQKHLPTDTHEEDEEGFRLTTTSALSQWGLLESIKPAYNQSWLDSWLKFTASAFYQLMTMDQYAGSPGRNTDYYGELAASFINLLHYCFPSSGFYGAGKDNRGRCTTSLSGHELRLPHLHHSPFLHQMPFPPQSCQFILAWDRHHIMPACIPSGLVWIT